MEKRSYQMGIHQINNLYFMHISISLKSNYVHGESDTVEIKKYFQ